MPDSTAGRFSILTLCTGNICRSPIAEQYLRAGLQRLPQVSVASAGTMANDGDGMPAQAEELARRYGIERSSHRARYALESHVSDAQLVLALAREHRRAAVSLWPRASRYAFTLREFARLAEGLADEDMGEIASMPTDDVPRRLSTLVSLVASRRGSVLRAATEIDDDVVDPYGRDDTVYALSGEQLFPAADVVIRTLDRAAHVTSVNSQTLGGSTTSGY
jgi:protein-tyrosine phosphatase